MVAGNAGDELGLVFFLLCTRVYVSGITDFTLDEMFLVHLSIYLIVYFGSGTGVAPLI